ncbi:PREDICTED: neuropilin-1a-like [Poecilia mexicana]|uniref:neuropilin-1a-like n=1 Tax=Poecilia mexicana TaxID=48701 RepID=UPI00072E76E7|nr:PREDICTED: neuropilin-1a-like [Poecilia mexicana]XP_014835326.1 PREDICTED: neuropilin-1a-like [Poecilia mexicana]
MPPMTTFGATTAAPTTLPTTVACPECLEREQDSDEETENTLVYDERFGVVMTPDPKVDFPAYVWFACNFDFSSLCGWTKDSGSGAEWFIQSSEAPAVHRGPTLDHTGRPHINNNNNKVYSRMKHPPGTSRGTLLSKACS